MALIVIRNVLAQLPDEDGPFRPRSDEAHLATQDVDELREFVKPVFSEKRADARHARVAAPRPLRSAFGFGVVAHRAEFEHAEFFAVQPYAGLPVDGRTLRIKPDGDSEEQPEG